MHLRDLAWPDVRDLSRDMVVLIPTGSLEQHGPHLPLFTDSILATAVAEAVEARLPEEVLLTPTLWLGASTHHLAFPGTLSNSFEAYMGAIDAVIESLIPHGFHRFYVLNGHGGNTDANSMVLRNLKAKYPELTLGHSGYFAFVPPDAYAVLEGPIKGIRHACEAEASMILYLRPELVRTDRLRDDGMEPDPPIRGLVLHFDEETEEGSYGYATLATAAKGKVLFEAAVEGVASELAALAEGFILRSLPERS